MFAFEPIKTSYHVQMKKKQPEIKRGINSNKNSTFSRPKERNMYDIEEN